MKILIADDDPVSRKLISRNLDNWGYEVIVASDGGEAWEIFQSDSRIHLALLDWIMPVKEGLEVCRLIKSADKRPFTHVIILTGLTDPDDLALALENGADDFVAKPFNAVELRARIRSGMRQTILHHKLKSNIRQLKQALADVKQLRGIIPICAWCKNIRDDSDYWNGVEEYLASHSEVTFTHSICPDCTEKFEREEEIVSK